MCIVVKARVPIGNYCVGVSRPTSALGWVRWGIIGAGNVTEVKSGPGLQRAERSDLVAVMRRDAAKAEDYARRHGVPRWYADPDALIADPEVDAVYIATPPDSHRDYTVRVLAAGKPVYVEKPMGRTEAECQEMLDAAEEAGLPLFVAYYRRAMPRFATIKQIIDDGTLGTVHAVVIRNQRPAPIDDGGDMPWRVRPDVSGGGHFVDLASHTLDLVDHLLAPIDTVSGYAANRSGDYPAEDLVAARFTLTSGVAGTGLWCYTAGEYRDEVEIVGSRAVLTFSSFGEEPLAVRTADGERRIDAPYPATVQQPLIQTVVDALTGHGTCPSTGATAIRTARVIDSVLADFRREHRLTFA